MLVIQQIMIYSVSQYYKDNALELELFFLQLWKKEIKHPRSVCFKLKDPAALGCL